MPQIKGTNVVAPVVPLDTADVHPSHEARYGKGGYRTVATIAERDAIPAPRREAGMLVYVEADGKAYQLGGDLATWSQFNVAASSWNDLTDRPATFPPSTHTHVHSDISNVPATLAQFTGNQDNLPLGAGGIIRISSDAASNITGFVATVDGDARLLVNVGSFAITLKHQDAASTEPNRIIGEQSQDLVIQPQATAVVLYDATSNRWRASGDRALTKSDVGLGNADNTSDANKPVSTAQAAANAAVQAYAVDRANHTGTQAASTISDFTAAVVAAAPPTTNASLLTSGTLDAARLPGSVVLTTDARLSDARQPLSHTHDDRYYTETEVDTLLAGKQATGSYVLTTDARLSDARQPLAHTHTASQISDFTSAVIAAAPPTTNASLLTSGTLPDARLSGNIARTSDVSAAVAAVVNAAPASLDTLKELADALGSDASFSATVTNSLASKAPIANPTFTGTVSGITKGMVGLGNVDNTSDASKPVSTAQAAADAAVASAAASDATSKANAAQAAAVQRANHTGTQTLSTISDAGTAASRNAPASGNASSTEVVLGSDTRLTDQRVPTDGSVTAAKIAAGQSISANNFVVSAASASPPSLGAVGFGVFSVGAWTFRVTASGEITDASWGGQTITVARGGTGATTAAGALTNLGAVATNDARLSDARTPTAHNQAWSTITSTPTTLAGYGITDAAAALHTHTVAQISDFSTSLASPPAIGGTTPAAGSFTTLSVSTALTVPSAASGTPAAGHVYRSADTLRYRDSANVERLILNSADNLANLGNTATARTNLGLGTAATAASSDFAAASHTHAASAITSGTLSVSRLPTVLEQTVTVGNSGTATTLTLTNGSVQTVTLSGNCTFTMPTATAGASLTLILTQSGTFTASFTGVLWAGGTAPTITATNGKVDVLVFVSNGTNWFGTAAQNF